MIINDSYVDDILHSCETISETYSKINATDEILKEGGFQIKQWVISGHHDMTEDVKVIDTEVEKVLGMIWEPKEDQFSFKFDKRMVLSQVASLYDPLGLLTPFTVQCKLLLRKLITLKREQDGVEQTLGWDDPIPDDVYGEWDGTHSAQLLAAKSRIAPLRQMTIPRLELCAAVLASRLRKTIEKESRFVVERVFHLVDSQIVRSQIQKESHGFETFVATRIAEIQTHTDPSEWWWVASDDNAADCATRPQHPLSLRSDSVWQKGPEYLTLPVEEWPISQPYVRGLPDRNGTSLSCKTESNQNTKQSLIDIESFSSYEKMINTTAIVLSICKKKTFHNILQNITSENLRKQNITG
ncbi:uncharacterized protein LOC123499782 [Portunus trituberculatus]|uniref:uncharacterized protein LOC123499782 n=1 Tax=Portunus trituberculatus TaxID=210409 RepID=UPI001E1D1D5C|nr:uncharacterized protein LOC123499782 [Portunus trituberculatus]